MIVGIIVICIEQHLVFRISLSEQFSRNIVLNVGFVNITPERSLFIFKRNYNIPFDINNTPFIVYNDGKKLYCFVFSFS